MDTCCLPSVLFVIISALLNSVHCSTTYQDPEEQIIQRIIKECTASKARVNCFAEKAATAIERSMNWNIALFDGIEFVRNNEILKEPPSQQQARSLSGLGRLLSALTRFADVHTLSLDLTKNSNEAPRKHHDDDGGGFGNPNRKALKKEKKYMQYAFMVLLGIFGLTGPLVMKTLAIIAAKALIASKVALIIVGSVALKKIFEKDHGSPMVKVHTVHTDDDHDRVYNQMAYSGYYEPYPKPA